MFIFFFTILYFEIIWQIWSIVKECQSFFVVIFYMNETRPNSFHDVQCTRFNNMRKKNLTNNTLASYPEPQLV